MKILPLIPSKSFVPSRPCAGRCRRAAPSSRPRKSFGEIGRGDDVFQERESAIIQLHHDTLERFEGGWDFDQVKRDRLIGAEHGARGNTEDERITNLSGSSGNRDVNQVS